MFLGPTAPVMFALGDKIASTILAQTSKVPVIPWNGEGIEAEITADGSIPQEPFKKACLQSYEEAHESVKRIGYPVVLKASEGGGGKGIRKATNDEELKLGWEQVTAEVAGSPIFMMQLCVGARHLEVQLMGDEHGDVIALSGRDCSTQRRFQKIFEEGPPTIAPRDKFREAEKAAQRLAKSVGYRGAGTVEYLFKPDSEEFFFLELNPRLQVEHPVTEGITGVNLPALQLLVGMGIPLSRVPDIRRFYGLEPEGTSKIDFLEDKYVYPDCHIMAARITAENPDDAFRPTSGAIERVRFQSTPSTWGYFSINANGSVHEFADSQFGHLFSKGKTRDEARKQMQLALQRVNITGEIRTPVEYLVELAETKEFKENTIHTAWLDGIIADKAVQAKFNVLDAIFYGACFRARSHIKEKSSTMLAALERGHLPLKNDLALLQNFSVEVAYDSTKYAWDVKRTGLDSFALTIGEATIEARFRDQPDGSLYIMAEGRTTQISGIEEPLSMRLRIEGGATVTFPRLRDPSELRSDFNGKIVRYLHADGDEVNEGEAFVELEAMKMIMSLRSTASGIIHHSMSASAIVGAGQLLATLDLKDPSSVQTVKPFSGPFALSAAATKEGPKASAASVVKDMSLDDVHGALAACLNGFALPPILGSAANQVVQRLFPAEGDYSTSESEKGRSCEICSELFSLFLKNELFFAGLVGGDETQIKAKFTGTPQQLLEQLIAHDALSSSMEVVASMLRCLLGAGQAAWPEALTKNLQALVQLPSEGGYGELRLLAWQVLQGSSGESNTGNEGVRAALSSMSTKDVIAMSDKANPGFSENMDAGKTGSEYPYIGTEIAMLFFNDADPAVRNKALELYIRRTYRGFDISDFTIVESKDVVDGSPGAVFHAVWTFSMPGVPETSQQSYAIILPTTSEYESLKKSWVMPSAASLAEVHVLVAAAPKPEMNDPKMLEESLKTLVTSSAEFIAASSAKLDSKSCPKANVMLFRDGSPTYLHFSKEAGWKEVIECRNLRPALPWGLELDTLTDEFTLSAIDTTRRSGIYDGTSMDKKTHTILLRTVSPAVLSLDGFEQTVCREIFQAFDMIARVNLNPQVDARKPMSRIFVHFLSAVPHSTERDMNLILDMFNDAVRKVVTKHASTILKLRLERIAVKVWVSPAKIPLKMIASSNADWDGDGLKETLDGKTGLGKEWLDIITQERKTNFTMLSPIEIKLHAKRNTARNAGSTYIYDFLGLFRIALTRDWLQSDKADKIPEKVFSAQELILNAEGNLVETNRDVAQNNVGIVVFQCELKTPAHPQGRKMILIGNDVTIKAGSFGTVEDDVFQRASQLAREKGLPRVYIACNSGARLGTVEELKSLVKVAWVDPADANKGFEYLYLKDADLQNLPADSVRSHPVKASSGETHHVLDAILGLNLASTKGGIGVENLQGSGLIAGETSRAYDETFTLSYVTGRSVGIGAYLNRLGQRNIQMVKGPMILTGYQALNKLLGQQVYTTQDQLGGPHIMVPNGVTHELVHDDSTGVEAILRWLSYISPDTASIPAIVPCIDSISREIAFMPTKAPYDPRHMLAGTKTDDEGWLSGFCDHGSFHEYMSGWGKTVVVGRGTLGGMPIGIVAVETRSVTRIIPADPADLTSHDISEAQAGQVWFPDSAFKTATAIRDFNRGENLPLIIFANWRGFSGGTRDMFAEVLKYGAMIVDALVEYQHPVSIYIPPNGELRGGAWVVLDPKINGDQMEMFADVEARGGILEPPAAAEIVFKQAQIIDMMHKNDDTLGKLDAEKAAGKDVDQEIKKREKLLLPMYKQVATSYCDLHDRSGRMKGLGAIHEELEWKKSRTYLHWRIRRRQQENQACKELRRKVPEISQAEAAKIVAEKVAAALGSAPSDQAVAEWLEANGNLVASFIEEQRLKAAENQIFALFGSLPTDKQADIARDLIGFTRVMKSK
jgi:acetyl-CoA carboxylase/biotin carboxylase 1